MRCNTTYTNPTIFDGKALRDIKRFTYLDSINDERGGSDADVKATDRQCKTSISATEEHLELKTTVNQHKWLEVTITVNTTHSSYSNMVKIDVIYFKHLQQHTQQGYKPMGKLILLSS
ncbi:unnamed protein product [Schistosoma margrebowiei]|uniref:Uncharacterized protein n=1 Tax=Schistosoma margrebowiei TaxID=48269 RepID=A0A183MWL7_9TREM|nr:unnamed protein product [Schistosoma margrebowiei]